VDYAFSPFGDLGDTHRFTLTFKFGKAREDILLDSEVKRVSRGSKFAPATKAKPSGEKAKETGTEKKDKSIYFLW
jgi:hypothetical protein